MSAGKSVRLFLADGTPGGLLTAEIMNWTGHVVAAPRSNLAELLKRPETGRTGLYLLIGDDPESVGGTIAYIGEGDNVRDRLNQHSRAGEQGGKDFWDRAIVLTSKDANLTKAHARYLESRFITLAARAIRAKLDNSTAPIPIQLPEGDISDMEYFIAQAQIVLPVLGINIFRSAAIPPAPSVVAVGLPAVAHSSPIFEFRQKNGELVATSQEIDGEFTVLEGSIARLSWSGIDAGYKRLREKLERDGTIMPSLDGKTARFAHNQVFASTSAAAVVVGRNANGRIEWKVRSTGMTYGSWQNEAIDRAAKGVAS